MSPHSLIHFIDVLIYLELPTFDIHARAIMQFLGSLLDTEGGKYPLMPRFVQILNFGKNAS